MEANSSLSASFYGPAVDATFPVGSFIEDYAYVSGSGDLDLCNGRWSITPDFPNWTYAYFFATDSSGIPVYPFIIGPKFYGNLPSMQNSRETLYTYYKYANSTSGSNSRGIRNESYFFLFIFVFRLLF